MTSISSGPRTIQGAGDPGEYGRVAYRGLHQAEQDTLQRLNEQGDLSTVLNFVGTSVRYTPDNTVKNGHLTDDGKENLLGFADEFIETYDKNADHALGHSDFYEKNESMAKWELEKLDYELEHPKLSDERRKQLEETKKNLFQFLDDTSARVVEFMDLPNSKGETDGLVSRDEAAAYFLTQDGTLEALKRNNKALKKEYQEKYPEQSWGWFQFKAGAGIALAQVVSRLTGKEAPFKLDGRISGPERIVSDIWFTLLPNSSREAIIQNYKEQDLAQYKP